MGYTGPDKEFGEHDDYGIGDRVWTYDATDGIIVGIMEGFPGQDGKDYEVDSNGKVKTYDASRLALIKRAEKVCNELS